jgi:hypothetical protein
MMKESISEAEKAKVTMSGMIDRLEKDVHRQ